MSVDDSYILFELAGATYALPSADIQQLEMATAPTPVPNAPPFVDGVVSVRGQVIPVMNLRARFGFPRVEPDVRSRVIVLARGGRTVGLLVDAAREFAAIAPGDILPPPEGVAGLSGRYLRGLARRGDRLLLVVDAAELLDVETTAMHAAPAPAPTGGTPADVTP